MRQNLLQAPFQLPVASDIPWLVDGTLPMPILVRASVQIPPFYKAAGILG